MGGLGRVQQAADKSQPGRHYRKWRGYRQSAADVRGSKTVDGSFSHSATNWRIRWTPTPFHVGDRRWKVSAGAVRDRHPYIVDLRRDIAKIGRASFRERGCQYV